MQLLRSLFFIEAAMGFNFIPVHVSGQHNNLADHLSRNRLSLFKQRAPPWPLTQLQSLRRYLPLQLQSGLAIRDLDQWVQFYFEQGLSSSTLKTYATGTKHFNDFCISHNITSPYPLSQSLLCYYVAHLAKQGLSPATIKVYLSLIATSRLL